MKYKNKGSVNLDDVGGELLNKVRSPSWIVCTNPNGHNTKRKQHKKMFIVNKILDMLLKIKKEYMKMSKTFSYIESYVLGLLLSRNIEIDDDEIIFNFLIIQTTKNHNSGCREVKSCSQN